MTDIETYSYDGQVGQLLVI